MKIIEIYCKYTAILDPLTYGKKPQTFTKQYDSFSLVLNLKFDIFSIFDHRS